jgi:plastocyanin
MRRPLIALTLAATALLVAACSSSAAPGWTYAPPTPAPAVTPAPSGGADASGAPEPTAVPGASQPAPSDGGNAAGAVEIGALNVAYTVTEVKAPSDAAFVIDFDNQDSGIPHNIEIKNSMNASVWKGDIVTGPIKTQYQVPALSAGDYVFVCTVHPNMIGNLHAGN